MRLAAIAAALTGISTTGACTGPRLHVDNPDRHRVLVDGVATAAPPPLRLEVPFRYYGTTAVDTLPAAGADGRPDWGHRPRRTLVPIDAPASGWLFPLDFPIELAARALRGRGDVTVTATVDAAPPPAEGELANAERGAVAERARAARIAR
jgi:hypothetical protein